jgi:hypothetical protein
MKTLVDNLRKMGMITLLVLILSPVMAQNGNNFLTVNGKLLDSKTKQSLFFAYVTIPDTHVGTVTNSEGDFTLKVNNSLNAKEVEFSHIGYKSKRVAISSLINGIVEVMLEPSSVSIDEVTIRPLDASKIVEETIQKIQYNYSDKANMLTGFYRETIKQRRDYISISEAVVDVYKAPYKDMGGTDRVKVVKARKSASVKKADTLAVKLQGGPSVSLLLDIMKNPDLIFLDESYNYYNFSLEDIVTIDNKLNYVISFVQKDHIKAPLYYGRLYIDMKNLALTNAQFSLNLDNKEEASKLFVLRKPRGVKFSPSSTSYYVTYNEYNGRHYLNYVRNELSFKANWSRRLFSTSYTVTAELAITDRDLENTNRIQFRESFKSTDVLADAAEAFNDIDFWGEHNYIKPEESIEDAIKKYGRRLKRAQ